MRGRQCSMLEAELLTSPRTTPARTSPQALALVQNASIRRTRRRRATLGGRVVYMQMYSYEHKETVK